MSTSSMYFLDIYSSYQYHIDKIHIHTPNLKLNRDTDVDIMNNYNLCIDELYPYPIGYLPLLISGRVLSYEFMYR